MSVVKPDKTLLVYQLTNPLISKPFVKVDGYVKEMYDKDGLNIFMTEPVRVDERGKLETTFRKLGFEGYFKFEDKSKHTGISTELSKIGINNVSYIALVNLDKEEVKKVWESKHR